MLLYYITDRTQFPGDESARIAALLARIGAAAGWGVDYIQLREKDLTTRELESLAHRAVAEVRKNSSSTKLLINSRIDVAIAAGADGVHLRSKGDLSASEARVIFAGCGKPNPVIACSCHTLNEVALAESHGADFAVFGPVFEKDEKAGVGLERLGNVCKREVSASFPMPVLALGGITAGNAAQCLEAGASGISGIRVFQGGELSRTLAALRRLGQPPTSSAPRRHPYQSG